MRVFLAESRFYWFVRQETLRWREQIDAPGLPPTARFHPPDKPMNIVESDLPELLDFLALSENAKMLDAKGLLYRDGLMNWRDGRFASAFSKLDRARDAAAKTRAAAVPLDTALQERFIRGEAIGSLFLDNVHPSATGAAWIAGYIADTLQKEGLLSYGGKLP